MRCLVGNQYWFWLFMWWPHPTGLTLFKKRSLPCPSFSNVGRQSSILLQSSFIVIYSQWEHQPFASTWFLVTAQMALSCSRTTDQDNVLRHWPGPRTLTRPQAAAQVTHINADDFWLQRRSPTFTWPMTVIQAMDINIDPGHSGESLPPQYPPHKK